MRRAGTGQGEADRAGWPHASWGMLCWGPLHVAPGALPRGGQDWKQLFPQEDDEGAPCPVEDELVLQDNGFLSKNEVLRSKVSRLTERLRKRCPSNNFGTARPEEGGCVGVVGPEFGNCGYWFVMRVRSNAMCPGPGEGSRQTVALPRG